MHSPAVPYCSQCSAPRSHGTTSHQAWGLFRPCCQKHKCLHLRWSLQATVPMQRRKYIPKPSLAGCLQRRARISSEEWCMLLKSGFFARGVYWDAGESCTMYYSSARTLKPALCVWRTKSSGTARGLAAYWAPGTNNCCAGKGQCLLWKFLCRKLGWEIWQSCREWCVAFSKAPQGLQDTLRCRNAILCP